MLTRLSKVATEWIVDEYGCTRQSKDRRCDSSIFVCRLLCDDFFADLFLRVVGNDKSNDNADAIAREEHQLYPIMVVKNSFLPLIGFGNLLVYSRPRYVQKRRRYKDLSRWTILKSVLLEESLKRYRSNARVRDETNDRSSSDDNNIDNNENAQAIENARRWHGWGPNLLLRRRKRLPL
jgi:hypothetical protein